MTSPIAKARLAGFLYLLSGILGVFSYLYIPSTFFVARNAEATASRIVEGSFVYRLGVLSDLGGQLIFLFLVWILYDLLKDADRSWARLMVILVAAMVAIEIVNVLNLVAPLILLTRPELLPAFTKPQVNALVYFFSQLRGDGILVVSSLWGLWLLPFGILVIKSNLFPKVLGFLLIAACVAYLVVCVTALAFPAYLGAVTWLEPLEGVGEGAMIVWLLIKGVKNRDSPNKAPEPTPNGIAPAASSSAKPSEDGSAPGAPPPSAAQR